MKYRIFAHKDNPGFTLVELLVVIAIISLLTSIILPNIVNARDKARTSRAANFAKNINTFLALQNYKGLLVSMDSSAINTTAGSDASSLAFTDSTLGNSFHGLVPCPSVSAVNCDKVTWSSDTPTKQGRSFQINGEAVYVYGPDATGISSINMSMPGSEGLTISFWIKREVSLSGADTGIQVTDGTAQVYIVIRPNVIDVNTIPLSGGNFSATINSKTDFNKWYHHVFTVKEGKMTYYIDGAPVYSNTSPSIHLPLLTNASLALRWSDGLWGYNTSTQTHIFDFYDLKMWENYFDPSNP